MKILWGFLQIFNVFFNIFCWLSFWGKEQRLKILAHA